MQRFFGQRATWRVALVAVLAALWLQTPLAAQQQAGDERPAAAAKLDERILAEAKRDSEIMANLTYLSDMIGPRLTGSAALKRANDWTLGRMKAYGLANVHL